MYFVAHFICKVPTFTSKLKEVQEGVQVNLLYILLLYRIRTVMKPIFSIFSYIKQPQRDNVSTAV